LSKNGGFWLFALFLKSRSFSNFLGKNELAYANPKSSKSWKYAEFWGKIPLFCAEKLVKNFC
jgi:hypothetical protein